ncbi:hypothetical protein CW690_09060 [Macrococcoides caseolyticum]|nr:hypothetical protein CW677_09065 [Macrococcus caseolyticus]PKF13944.1 hypothetical protein CW690_09060 [Macrococcus caseolyticus]
MFRMQINKLRSFIKVAEHHNFSQAAESLFLNQSTISKHVDYVEKLVNKKLFERKQKGTELTNEGELFYKYAKEIVILYDQAIETLGQKEAQQTTRVVIGATPLYGERLLPKLINDIYQRNNKLKIKLIIGSSSEIMSKLSADQIDIAFVSNYIKIDAHYFIKKVIYKDQLQLVAPKAYWPQSPIALNELKKETFIIKSEHSSLYHFILKELKQIQSAFEFEDILEIGSQKSILESVKYGQGVSIVSELLIEKLDSIVVFELDKISLSRQVLCVYKKSRSNQLSHITKSFNFVI